MKGKTGYRELAAALALSRVFAETAPLPDSRSVYGMQRFTVIAVSFLLALIVWLPLYFIMKRSAVSSPDTAAPAKNRALTGFAGALFSVYLLFSAADTGLRAHYYTSSTIFDSAPSVYFYVLVGAALIFAVYKGTEATVRAAFTIGGLFLFLLLVMIPGLVSEIDLNRLYPSLIDDSGSFVGQVLREFSLNCEIPLFAVLGGTVKEKRGRVIPLYIVISCVVMLLMTFLYTTVFGYLVTKLELPFYSLSSAADISVLHRVNGIDVMICEMAGMIRLALITLTFREVVKMCFTGDRAATIAAAVFAAVALALSELFTAYPSFAEPIRLAGDTGLPLIAFTVLMPLLMLAGKRRRSL